MLTRKTTSWLLFLLAIVSAVAWFEHQQLPGGGLDALPPSLLPFTPASASSLAVKTTDLHVVCTKEDDTWKIAQPAPLRADSNRIGFVIETLARADVQDRVTLRERRNRRLGLDDYGLVIPRAVVTIASPEGEAELRFGADTPFGNGVFAMRAGSPNIFIADRAAFDVLPKSIDDVRNRTLVPVSGSEISRIEIRQPGKGVVRLEAFAEGWRLTDPFPIPASPAAVQAVLESIEHASIERFVPTQSGLAHGTAVGLADGAAYGVSAEESPLTASVYYKAGKAQINLAFGKSDPALPENVYVLSSLDDVICTVGKALLDALKMDAEALREHRIFPILPGNLVSAAMQSPGGAFAMKRDSPTSGWTISTPSGQPADQDAAAHFISALLGLEDASVMQMSDEEALTLEQGGLDLVRIDLTATPPIQPFSAFFSFPRADADAPATLEVWVPSQKRRHTVTTNPLPTDFMTPKGFAALRDKTVLAIPTNMLSAITKRNAADEDTVLRGRDGGWFSAKPLPVAANPEGIAALTSALADLKAAAVETLFAADTAPYGLAPPHAEFTLATRVPERPVVILLLGTPLQNGSAYVKVKGQDAVFLVSSNIVNVLSSPLVIKPTQPEGIPK